MHRSRKSGCHMKKSAGIIGSGKSRVTAGFIKICSRSGSMTDLAMISGNTGLATGVSRTSRTTLATTGLAEIGPRETSIADAAIG